MMEASGSSRTSRSESMGVLSNQRKGTPGIRLENPFTFKVGQVFTGFGVGCGVGIGVGRPINLGAVPVLNQVMSATRGATDAFSGFGRHVNGSMRKLGAKNIEAGIGCGVGFGHGFGIGLAVKPSVLNQIQACLMQTMAKMMMKFGMNPNLDMGQRASPDSLLTGMSLNELSHQIPVESSKHIAPPIALNPLGYGNMATESTYSNVSSSGTVIETPFGTRTEKVISSFLQNPILKGGDTEQNDVGSRLEAENNMLQMVMKHQQLIEKLMEENRKLRRVLMEDLKIPPAKLEESFSGGSKLWCSDCFECRRKHRRRK